MLSRFLMCYFYVIKLKAILCTLISAGLRISEPVSLKPMTSYRTAS